MTEDPFMKIDLKNHGGELIFLTSEDLLKWIDDEYNYWNWCMTPINQDGALGNILNNTQMAAITQLRSNIHQLQVSPHLKNTISSIFNSYYPIGRAITSKSPTSKFIQIKRDKEGDVVAAWSLAALTSGPGMTIVPNSFQAMCGVVAAVLFKNGIKNSALSEKTSLDQLYVKYSDIICKSIIEQQQQSSTFESFKQDFQTKLENVDIQINQMLTGTKSSLLMESNAAKENLLSVEKTYDEKLSLQAPVTYWENKKTTHGWVCFGLSIFIVIFMGFSIWAISAEIWELLPEITPGQFPSPWKLAVVIVSFTMFIWVNRILIKIFLSQLHLYTDAQERTILITTYLSLLRSDEALKDQDRSLILQILFRPVATGIVDDGGPAAGMEVFTKLISGGKL